jgi:hypothetical protein
LVQKKEEKKIFEKNGKKLKLAVSKFQFESASVVAFAEYVAIILRSF